MEAFFQKHRDKVTGVLSGLDRLILRGTIRQLAHLDGLDSYLATKRVLLKNFGKHAEELSSRLKDVAKAAVERIGRGVLYLPSSRTNKEQVAREIAERDRVTEGTIVLLTCIEPCQSFVVYRCRESKHIRLRVQQRKCLFLYRYFIDPDVGFGHARIQSWFPFNAQVYVNGREWLARQMERAGIGYCRRENCFTSIDDVKRAQELMKEQLRVDWPALLDRLLAPIDPRHAGLFGEFRTPFYWSVYQSEWATDFMFRDDADLARLYPRLIRYGIENFGSRDVLRFLGRKVPTYRAAVHGNFKGEVVSDMRERPEGVRIKHRVGGNSIKLYDKQGSVLRTETTIGEPGEFKVYRPKEGDEQGSKSWRKMRKGVADLHRRCEVSQAANDRYLDALAATDDEAPLGEVAAAICKPTRHWGTRFRALRPWDRGDLELLRTVSRGEFTMNGFRNRDLRRLLLEPLRDSGQQRRQSAAIGRRLRLLRAHGLIAKVPKTHRYKLTADGRTLVVALIAAHAASTSKLALLAA